MDKARLSSRLVVSEGKRSKVYKDSLGIDTIGVGRNIRDVGLSDDEILYLLNNDIERVITDLDKRLPWWRQMSEPRQSVLADMCFNMGVNKLCSFINTLKAMQAGNYAAAADGMLASLWAKQVKGRADDLARIMRNGQY